MPRQFGVPEEVIEEVRSGKRPISDYSPYMEKLHNKHVIAVNEAYKIGDWVDVLFFGDIAYYRQNKDEIRKFKKLKVSFHEIDPHVKYIPKSRNRSGLSSTRITWNMSSGAAAINLAVLFGAKKIILLGFDMHTKGPLHWHGSYPTRGGAALERTFTRHMKGFSGMNKAAKKMGVTILNANPDSAIEEFTKVDLNEVL